MTPANDNNPMTGKQVSRIRILAGMTNKQLAAHLDMSVNSLRKITLGKADAGPKTVAKLEALERRNEAA